MAIKDPRIDTYISRAAPFAQPILRQIRAAVHAASPDIQETMKWSHPNFDHKGIMCGMAAFKQYATFGFWKSRSMAERLSTREHKALQQIGRIKLGDRLPDRATLVRLVQVAAELNDQGVVEKRPKRRPLPALKTPAFVLAALKKNPKALSAYRAFPPSHQREYVEWITEAKQDETRRRRLAQAIAWIAEGKSRNWKYERT